MAAMTIEESSSGVPIPEGLADIVSEETLGICKTEHAQELKKIGMSTDGARQLS